MTTIMTASPERKDENEGNTIEDYRDELEEIFDRKKEKIPSLINFLNSAGYSEITSKKIAQLLETEEKDVKYIRDAIVTLTHGYVSHRDELEDHSTNAKVDRRVIDDLKSFLSSLNENALRSLDKTFFLENSGDKVPCLREITDSRLLLSKVSNHEKQLIGYLPLVRIRMSIDEENDESTDRAVFMSLDELRSLIRYLSKLYNDLKEEALEYRKSIGDSVAIMKDD